MKRHPTPVPELVVDEVTGVHEGEELARLRAKRPTDQRIAHIEKRLDEAVADGKRTAEQLSEMRADLGSMSGKLDVMLSHVIAAHQEQAKTEQVRIGSRAKVWVSVATALGVIGGAIATAILSSSGCS